MIKVSPMGFYSQAWDSNGFKQVMFPLTGKVNRSWGYLTLKVSCHPIDRLSKCSIDFLNIEYSHTESKEDFAFSLAETNFEIKVVPGCLWVFQVQEHYARKMWRNLLGMSHFKFTIHFSYSFLCEAEDRVAKNLVVLIVNYRVILACHTPFYNDESINMSIHFGQEFKTILRVFRHFWVVESWSEEECILREFVLVTNLFMEFHHEASVEIR